MEVIRAEKRTEKFRKKYNKYYYTRYITVYIDNTEPGLGQLKRNISGFTHILENIKHVRELHVRTYTYVQLQADAWNCRHVRMNIKHVREVRAHA